MSNNKNSEATEIFIKEKQPHYHTAQLSFDCEILN